MYANALQNACGLFESIKGTCCLSPFSATHHRCASQAYRNLLSSSHCNWVKYWGKCQKHSHVRRIRRQCCYSEFGSGLGSCLYSAGWMSNFSSTINSQTRWEEMELPQLYSWDVALLIHVLIFLRFHLKASFKAFCCWIFFFIFWMMKMGKNNSAKCKWIIVNEMQVYIAQIWHRNRDICSSFWRESWNFPWCVRHCVLHFLFTGI